MQPLLNMPWQELADLAMPIMLLICLAIAVLGLDLIRKPMAKSGVVPLALCGTLLVMWLGVPRWIAAETPQPMALWFFDRISWVGAMVVLGITALSILMAPTYLRNRNLPRGEYLALLLFGVVGLWVMMATHHLMMMFIGLETLSIGAYVLAAYHRNEDRSIEAGLKYLIIGAVASAFLLLGMAYLYGGTGTLDLLAYQSFGGEDLPNSTLYVKIGAACLLAGFGFKLAAVPFQWWAPDVYAGAPLPVTAFFATAVKCGAFIALWRIVTALAPLTGVLWGEMFWWLAVATMTIGNLAALTQTDLKRMLAYSSIAHAGYALIALVVTASGESGVVVSLLFYLIAYSLMTLGAFAVLIALGGHDHEATDLSAVSGLARRRPWLAAAFALFLLSLAGLPPTVGFFGKYYLFSMAIGAGETWLVIIAVLNSVLSVAYYVRPIVEIYFRTESEENTMTRGSFPALVPGVRVVIILALIGVLLYGLYPSGLLTLLARSVG
jgi:NADH-quinone oxidoreductase subunit N